MKHVIGLSMLALALAGCGGSSSSTPGPAPQSTPVTPTEPSQFAAIESAATQDLASNHAVAVSIAIYQDGEVVFADAFGKKQDQGSEDATSNTLFQLGSTTKMFTGLAALQLVDQGVLNLDDRLVDVLPGIEYPESQAADWQNITIHHLLTHQSGLTDDYSHMSNNMSLLDYMSETYGVANLQMNPPGLFYNYSNPNWSFLGAVVEYHTQTNYVERMEESVFEPLGMTRTTMDRTKVSADGDFAIGVTVNEQGTRQPFTSLSQILNLEPVIPAGSYTWSTPTEMLEMADFLLNGNLDILSEENREQATVKHVNQEIAGLPMHYGYGIVVSDGFSHGNQWYFEPIWEHGGNTDAYTSMFWVLPERNVAVSILSSGVGDDFTNTMVAALESVIELPTPTNLPIIPIDRTKYADHEGFYTSEDFTIEVRQVDGELMINVPELDEASVPYRDTLEPVGDRTFRVYADDDEHLFTFFSQEEGGASIYMRNRNVVGIREGNETAPSIKEPTSQQLKRSKTVTLD